MAEPRNEEGRTTNPASLARINRTILGERLADTAAAIGVQVSHLSKMERGREPIPSKIAAELGKHFFGSDEAE